MLKIETLHKVDTEYSADSVEWCPFPDYTSFFVCGTYQLENDQSDSSLPCRRKGRIYLFKYDNDNNTLKEVCRIETAAILDMKWIDASTEHPTLAAASALGEIEIFILKSGQLERTTTFHLNTEIPNLLALSLDWSKQSSSNLQIIASDSSGHVSLLDCLPHGLEKVSTWSAHGFEAWTCCFDRWNSSRIFTGGDDTFMHAFDYRLPTEINKVQTCKSHLAGVTSLLSHPTKENILVTGSYDEKLRIFDTNRLKEPIADVNLNGGIWRIKPDPKNRTNLLCACMYHNFSIVKLDQTFTDLKVVGEYGEHESICYGADWNPCECEENTFVMATCSFYDNKLCVSRVSNLV